VFLTSREGAKLELRLDARMPGTVLLRDPQGYVYFMTFNTIQQVGAGCALCVVHLDIWTERLSLLSTGVATQFPGCCCADAVLGLCCHETTFSMQHLLVANPLPEAATAGALATGCRWT
jgi:hypothetical protein